MVVGGGGGSVDAASGGGGGEGGGDSALFFELESRYFLPQCFLNFIYDDNIRLRREVGLSCFLAVYWNKGSSFLNFQHRLMYHGDECTCESKNANNRNAKKDSTRLGYIAVVVVHM